MRTSKSEVHTDRLIQILYQDIQTDHIRRKRYQHVKMAADEMALG